MKLRLVCVCALLFMGLFVASASPMGGEVVSASEPGVLTDVRAVCVVVQRLPPDLVDAGVSKVAVRDAVERILHQRGVNVMEPKLHPLVPVLSINVSSVATDVLVAYTVDVELCDSGWLTRNPTTTILNLVSWRRGYIGMAGKTHIGQAVRDNVDQSMNEFCVDYLKVHAEK